MSPKGNGAAVVLPFAVVALLACEVAAARRQSRFGVMLLPMALFAGLFVVAGGF